MKLNIFLFIFFLLGYNLFAQNKYSGKVLDKQTLKPIEFVNIYNANNYTITNEDGEFDFESKLDSIKFNFLGFDELKKTIDELPRNGIIYLTPKTFELDEVVLSNENATFKKMVATIKNSFPSKDYTEEFFLRTILKRNDTIIKIQDLNGVVNRKVLFSTEENPIPKKNYTVYINQMRKASYKDEEVHFVLLDFDELLTNFVRIAISPKSCYLKKSLVKDSNLLKLDFEPKSETNKFKGYYLMNSIDYSLNKVYWINANETSFTEKRHIRYRTTQHDLLVNFFREKKNNHYRIKNAKKNYHVDVFYKENKKIIYEVTYIYKTKEFDGKLVDLKNKVSTKRDIFKIKHPFDKKYWNSTQHLKLTEEMEDFLTTLSKSDRKTVTNFKN